MFGMTAKQWREANPELKGNIRDYATINELICLSNMENLNAVFIEQGVSQGEIPKKQAYRKFMRTHYIILIIILLVLIDQCIKLVIYSSLMDVNHEIIPGVLDFTPIFNSKYSFVNDSVYKKTGIDFGLLFHIVLFVIAWFIQFVGYMFFKSIDSKNITLDLSISCLTAAIICSFLGMLVWSEGILDFLHIKLIVNIIFDLKDIYINCFIVLFSISTARLSIKYNIKLTDFSNYLKSLFSKQD